MKNNRYISGTLTLTDFINHADKITQLAYKGPHYPCVFSKKIAFFTTKQVGHTELLLLNTWNGQSATTIQMGTTAPKSPEHCIRLIKKALAQYPGLSDYYFFVPQGRLADSICNEPGLVIPHRPDHYCLSDPTHHEDSKNKKTSRPPTEKRSSAPPGGPSF